MKMRKSWYNKGERGRRDAAVVEMSHVTKDYGQVRGLTDFSLTTSATGIVGLLGQNGAGKTTAMNLVT